MQYINFFKRLDSGEKYIVSGIILSFIFGGFGDLPPLFGLIVMTIGFIKIVRKKGCQEVFNTPLTRPLLLLFVVAILSLVKVFSYISVFNMLGTMLEIVAGFFIVFYFLKNRKEQFHKKMVSILLIGGLITGLYGLYEGFFIVPRRLESIIGNANLLGVYMMFMLFLGLSLFYKKNYKNWAAGCVLFLIFGYNLMFSLSFSALVGTVAAFMLFFTLLNKKLLIVFFIILALSPQLIPGELTQRIESTYTAIQEGDYQRPFIYKSAYEMFTDNPVLGVGIGHFREHFFDYNDPEAPRQDRQYNHAHNIILQVLSELGLMGLLAFLYLLAMIVKTTYRALPFTHDFKGYLCLLFTSAFFGFFFQEQTEFSLISSAIAVLVGILLGWWMALLAEQKKGKETKTAN